MFAFFVLVSVFRHVCQCFRHVQVLVRAYLMRAHVPGYVSHTRVLYFCIFMRALILTRMHIIFRL